MLPLSSSTTPPLQFARNSPRNFYNAGNCCDLHHECFTSGLTVLTRKKTRPKPMSRQIYQSRCLSHQRQKGEGLALTVLNEGVTQKVMHEAKSALRSSALKKRPSKDWLARIFLAKLCVPFVFQPRPSRNRLSCLHGLCWSNRASKVRTCLKHGLKMAPSA